MNRRGRIALSATAGILAMVVSMLSVGSVRQEAERREREMLERYGGELASVCITTSDIEPGEKMGEDNVAVGEWVSSLLPVGALTGLSDVIGRTATARIPAHTPLAEAYFVREEEPGGIPEGKVAVSVASDPEHALGGALKRGERVDVYIQGQAGADRLTDAEVIDSSVMASGGGDIQWVTLAVHPSAVGELLAATSRGMVALVAPGTHLQSGDGRSQTGDGDDAGGARSSKEKDAGASPRSGPRPDGGGGATAASGGGEG